MTALHTTLLSASVLIATSLGCDTPHETPPATSARPASTAPVKDWRAAEKSSLAHHVQLTFSDRFVKAGECYFSPDDRKVIFQAVEKPSEGEAEDDFYAMYVADVMRETSNGNITGIDNIKRISPQGTANTCGWFHPTEPDIVIFATTVTAPSDSTPPGFQRASGRYKWTFPPEMRIVRCDLSRADGTAATIEVIAGDDKSYQAEGSISNDGRYLLYCSLESGDGDLFIVDLKTGAKNRIVQSKGYDGGPFFSPDGKRICYRSDRNGDNLLQLFVAELAFNQKGEAVGIQREYQLTDDPWVNWCPFWTIDGRRLAYSSSELGESNFEVFMIDADPGDLPGSNGTIKYGTAKRRVTYFEDAGQFAASDVLPAFSNDGKWMVWASRRGQAGDVHLWTARMLLNPDTATKPMQQERAEPQRRSVPNRITITDPETDRIFIYDPVTHALSEYDMSTHKLTEVTDVELMRRVVELYELQKEPD